MFVEFKKLSFCTIMSYGASGAEIDFQTGLNTIKAANGSGKSSILDALTFVLFGKPYRDIKFSELVNTANGKGLEVTCEFKIGTDTYMIRRGLKPAVFEIYKNGKEMDMLSTKKLNQDEIDKLLGINLRLFKNIVAVAVTNNRPFLSLPIGDKRALIENIFNIDVLGSMCKDVKKRKTVNNTELDLKTTERRGVVNSIEDNESYIENMRRYIASFNEVKDANLKTIRENIDKYQKEIDKRTKNLAIAESKIKELSKVCFGVAYGSNIKQVSHLVVQAVGALKCPYIDREKALTTIVTELGDNSVNMKFLCWVDVTKQALVESQILSCIYDTLNEHNIEIPFPQRDIHIKNG